MRLIQNRKADTGFFFYDLAISGNGHVSGCSRRKWQILSFLLLLLLSTLFFLFILFRRKTELRNDLQSRLRSGSQNMRTMRSVMKTRRFPILPGEIFSFSFTLVTALNQGRNFAMNFSLGKKSCGTGIGDDAPQDLKVKRDKRWKRQPQVTGSAGKCAARGGESPEAALHVLTHCRAPTSGNSIAAASAVELTH